MSQAPTHHGFTFTLDSYMSPRTRFVFLKLRVRFSIFDPVSFLLNFIFLLKQCMDSLNSKRQNSFHN